MTMTPTNALSRKGKKSSSSSSRSGSDSLTTGVAVPKNKGNKYYTKKRNASLVRALMEERNHMITTPITAITRQEQRQVPVVKKVQKLQQEQQSQATAAKAAATHCRWMGTVAGTAKRTGRSSYDVIMSCEFKASWDQTEKGYLTEDAERPSNTNKDVEGKGYISRKQVIPFEER